MQTIGIGLVGYGGIGKIHTLCYKDVNMFYPGQLPNIDLVAVCTSKRETAQRAAAEGGYRMWCTNNYRFIPALLRAHELAQAGVLGEIYRFRTEYLHTGYQDPQRPLSWRMNKTKSGGGALADLGVHLIDLIRHLLGEIDSIQAITHTYIPERPIAAGAQTKAPVTVDDAAWVQMKLQNGALGTLEVSRFATGAMDDVRLEICGSKGALRFYLMEPNWLWWFDAARQGGAYGGERGWVCLETGQQYPGASIPPARAVLGWTRPHAEDQYQFLKALVTGHTPQPNVLDGLRAQPDNGSRWRKNKHWIFRPTPRFIGGA